MENISENTENYVDLSESNLRKKRKKSSYTKINNDTRLKLLEMVYVQNFHLKEAARILRVNYSTAKTILRVFRVEKRIEKKNAEEERNLKALLLRFNNPFSKEEKSTHSSEICGFVCKNEIQFDVISNISKKQDVESSKLNYLIQNVTSLLKVFRDNSILIKENSKNLNFLIEYLQNLKNLNFGLPNNLVTYCTFEN